MNNKIIALVMIGILVVGGGSFYLGTFFRGIAGARAFGAQGGQFAGSAARGGFTGGMTRGSGFTAGTILSKDATSITVKMQDGSTKIVLVGGSTEVMKTISGTTDDLSVGTNVTVMGTTNTDKSVTAQSIQIRPAGMPTTTPAY